MTQPGDNFEQQLSGELKRLYAGPGASRLSRDQQILAAARSAGEAALRGRDRWRWRIGLSLAAAVALAAGVLWSELSRNGSLAPLPPALSISAHNRTGDIRDAYFVARQLKQNQALEAGWDTNGDGVVDMKDVQALALAAVRLPAEKGDVR